MNALGKTILKNVSRSFYLSIRVLPAPMREPVSLGYLLARASDTLADTESLDAELRLEMLDGMAAVLAGENREAWLQRLEKEVIPHQGHAGERVLLQQMEGVMDWLDSLGDSEEKQAIFTVMKHILRGQRLDIERFELREDFLFSSDDQLEEYCYLVAGCVGEFWTEVGFATLRSFSTESKSQLMEWGCHYGKGLQLINILRDLPRDLQAGRCYLPGVNPEDPAELMQASVRWRRRARRYLADGESYAQSLTGRRIYIATVLPCRIGSRTLDLMDQADWETLSRGVKVKRSEVYRCFWKALLG
jgi:farnesyl-diphosphate farnesyltransferase